MKELFKEIYQYQYSSNQRLLEYFISPPGSLPERTYKLFCHILNAHQIWNARILGKESIGVNDQHTLDECRTLDVANYETTKSILDTRELAEVISYKTKAGQDFSNTIRDILFHTVNHGTHYRGQIISDLRISGIEPPVTDYIFYKRQV